MAPKKVKCGSKTEDASIRQSYAKIVEMSTKIYADPCKTCSIDFDKIKKCREAKPSVDFDWSLVAYLTEEGRVDASTVYLTPSEFLTGLKTKVLNFKYGADRVRYHFKFLL